MDQDLIIADDLDALSQAGLDVSPDARPTDATAAGTPPDVASLQAEIARLKQQQTSDAALAEMRAEIERLKADRREPTEAPTSYRMSKAERDQYNPQAIERISQDPLGFLEDYEEKVLVPRIMARMQKFAQPAMGSAAELVTDAFLSRSTKDLPERMRADVEREFQTEMADLAPTLLTMPPEQRQAEMKRRLDAATGRVAVRAYQTRAASPRTITSGGGGGGAQQRGTKLQQIAEQLGYDEVGAEQFMKSSKLTEDEMYETLFGKGA